MGFSSNTSQSFLSAVRVSQSFLSAVKLYHRKKKLAKKCGLKIKLYDADFDGVSGEGSSHYAPRS